MGEAKRREEKTAFGEYETNEPKFKDKGVRLVKERKKIPI